jgi:hypothetical protein
MLRPNSDTSLNGTSPGFEFIFTPTATGTYKFRADAAGVGRSYQIGQSESSASIRQIGSTSNVNTLPAFDNSAAGYFDIGNMRMQWGTFTQGSAAQTVTLPAPFANLNYVVVGNDQTSTSSTTVRGTSFSSQTTNDFISLTNSTNATTVNAAAGNTIGYIAIGVKP